MDLSLTLLPAAFVILALVSMRSDFGDKVLEAVTSYGPTIFPNMLAGLVGHTMSALALHRVKRDAGIAVSMYSIPVSVS